MLWLKFNMWSNVKHECLRHQWSELTGHSTPELEVGESSACQPESSLQTPEGGHNSFSGKLPLNNWFYEIWCYSSSRSLVVFKLVGSQWGISSLSVRESAVSLNSAPNFCPLIFLWHIILVFVHDGDKAEQLYLWSSLTSCPWRQLVHNWRLQLVSLQSKPQLDHSLQQKNNMDTHYLSCRVIIQLIMEFINVTSFNTSSVKNNTSNLNWTTINRLYWQVTPPSL